MAMFAAQGQGHALTLGVAAKSDRGLPRRSTRTHAHTLTTYTNLHATTRKLRQISTTRNEEIALSFPNFNFDKETAEEYRKQTISYI